MKYLKPAFLLFQVLLAYHPGAKAQKVNIGDKCPDIMLTNIINSSSKTANIITSFNDKPLIIDFWFIGCAPCMELIPLLDSLRRVYKDQFNVLLVTNDNEKEVTAFLKKNASLRNITLPIATGIKRNNNIRKLFPHTSEPHEIWIDKKGVVQAITSHEHVTSKNLEAFIHGYALNIPEKKEFDEGITMGNQPLLITDRQYNEGKGQLFYSYLGDANPQLANLITSGIYDEKNGVTRILCQNCSIESLYLTALTKPDSENRITVQQDPANKARFETDSKSFKNTFCYELVIKDTSFSNAQRIMKQQLDNYFLLQSSLQKEKIPCYVLSRVKNNKKFIPQKETTPIHEDTEDGKTVLKSMDISYLVTTRLYDKLKYQVINETDYNGKVDLVIPKSGDINIIKKEINKSGLDINLELRERPKIVLQNIN